MNDRDKEAEDARRTLSAMSRDGGSLGAGPRMREDDGAPQDAVELWAKRIGRALGFVFLALLAINLFTGWFF
jgi:hypothetical protein